jgi:hypothetical protein
MWEAPAALETTRYAWNSRAEFDHIVSSATKDTLGGAFSAASKEMLWLMWRTQEPLYQKHFQIASGRPEASPVLVASKYMRRALHRYCMLLGDGVYLGLAARLGRAGALDEVEKRVIAESAWNVPHSPLPSQRK